MDGVGVWFTCMNGAFLDCVTCFICVHVFLCTILVYVFVGVVIQPCSDSVHSVSMVL